MGVLSQQVPHVTLGVAVTNPVTRHPAVTANAIHTLAECAKGHVFVGIGTGDTGVYLLGQRASTLRYLQEYIGCLKNLLNTGFSVWQGETIRVGPERAITPHIPIYMAAHGVRSLEVAAAVADGIFLGLGHSEDVIEAVLKIVTREADRANRDSSQIDLWWNTSGGFSVAEDSDQAIAAAGCHLASIAHHFTRFAMESELLPVEFQYGVRELGRLYRLDQHGRQSAESRERYIQAAMRLGVWEYLCRRFLIAGTEAEVTRHLMRLQSMGIRKFGAGLSFGGLTRVSDMLEFVRRFNSADHLA